MHNAPSVSYPVGRCALAWRLWAMQAGVSALLLALWGMSQAVSFVWVLAGLWMASASAWGWRQIRRGAGALAWDGERWRWCPEASGMVECIGEVKMVLDAQKALLLKWQSASDTLRPEVSWLWLAEEACPARWQDLRRAVYGPRRQ